MFLPVHSPQAALTAQRCGACSLKGNRDAFSWGDLCILHLLERSLSSKGRRCRGHAGRTPPVGKESRGCRNLRGRTGKAEPNSPSQVVFRLSLDASMQVGKGMKLGGCIDNPPSAFTYLLYFQWELAESALVSTV